MCRDCPSVSAGLPGQAGKVRSGTCTALACCAALPPRFLPTYAFVHCSITTYITKDEAALVLLLMLTRRSAPLLQQSLKGSFKAAQHCSTTS